jgi:hypothetical protein
MFGITNGNSEFLANKAAEQLLKELSHLANDGSLDFTDPFHNWFVDFSDFALYTPADCSLFAENFSGIVAVFMWNETNDHLRNFIAAFAGTLYLRSALLFSHMLKYATLTESERRALLSFLEHYKPLEFFEGDHRELVARAKKSIANLHRNAISLCTD